MRLYTHGAAPNPRRPGSSAACKGIELATRHIDRAQGARFEDGFRAITPTGMVPALHLAGITLLALTLAAALASAGCGSRGPDAPYADYRDRVARTLSQPPAAPVAQRPLGPPRAARLRAELKAGNIAALDFLALRGCALQTNVARRNSALGRVAPPSQRLLLDLEFLRDAPACEAQLRSDGKAALAGQLREEYERKRAQLPLAIYDAVLASEEFQQFWRPDTDRSGYPASTGPEILETLDELTALARRWRGGDYRADDARFEQLLARLARGDGGTLLRALEREDAWLAAVDRIMASRLQSGPLCRPQRQPQAARTLDTVLRKFFIGRLQPRIAALDLRERRLIGAVRRLERALEPLPDSYTAWRDARESRLSDFREAPRRHVREVQRILEPCGLLPVAAQKLRSSAGKAA